MRHNLLNASWVIQDFDGQHFLCWDPSLGESDRFAHLPVQSKPISPEEALELIEKDLLRRDEIASEKKEAADKKAAYDSYVNSLPEQLGDFRRGHLGNQSELEDAWGNYCGSVPRKAVTDKWSAADLISWLSQQDMDE